MRTKKQVIAELSAIPPMDCDINKGDTVTYTNTNGVVFKGLKVLGFGDPLESNPSAFIYLDTDSYWFPHDRNELTLEKRHKTESASKVLQLMDSDEDAPDLYSVFLRQVAKEDGISIEQLSRELTPFI